MMLQTHNEIVGFFFLFFVVALRFFLFVSAFFSFCFVFFFRSFWFLFNYRKGVVNLHTVECGNVHKAILYFFTENTMLRLWPFWNVCSKGKSPNFGENIVQFYSRGGDNGIWGTWAICMYQYRIKVLVRNGNLERTAEVRWHEVLTYFYTNCFKRLCKLELTIWRNSSKRVEIFLKRKISIC